MHENGEERASPDDAAERHVGEPPASAVGSANAGLFPVPLAAWTDEPTLTTVPPSVAPDQASGPEQGQPHSGEPEIEAEAQRSGDAGTGMESRQPAATDAPQATVPPEPPATTGGSAALSPAGPAREPALVPLAVAVAAPPAAVPPEPKPRTIVPDPELQRPFEPASSPPAASQYAIGQGWRHWLGPVLRVAGKVAIGYAAAVGGLILLYRFVDPPASTLMVFQRVAGQEIHREWVPLERVSPALIRSVIAAEDGRFCSHWGIDLGAMKDAIERAKDGLPRGASTISMQVAKNLFLWPGKSFLRKAIEMPVTLAMEVVWPKWRMLEIYLNIAEWGPAIFGAEAASQFHFKKPAAKLSEREAALLAAALPNPIVRDAGDPGPRTARKAAVIQARARAETGAADCVLSTLESR